MPACPVTNSRDTVPMPRHDQRSQAWDANREYWQEILNALPIPPRRAQVNYRADVLARLVWERDGEEWIETRTMAYTRDAVLVVIRDRRWQLVGVWLPPGDVRRR